MTSLRFGGYTRPVRARRTDGAVETPVVETPFVPSDPFARPEPEGYRLLRRFGSRFRC